MTRSNSITKTMMLALGLTTAISSSFLSITAQAAPTFDAKLERFRHNEALGNEMVRVVAIFKNKMQVSRARHSVTSRVQIEREMIQNAAQSQASFVQSLQTVRAEGKLKAHRLWLINGLLLEMPAKNLKLLESNPDVSHVVADFRVGLIRPKGGQLVRMNRDAAFTYGLQKLQIPELRNQAPSITGKGIRVAVVDTGIDGTHPDLKGRVVAFKDFVSGKPNAYDDNMHGTHCAGSIGGGNTSGTAIGVAPEVQFIGAKFLDKNGSGTFANALAALQWVADPDNNPNTNDGAMVASNSWGAAMSYSNEDPAANALCQASASLMKLGVVPVFAAGNEGPGPRTVGLPGGCPTSVTVGATDASDGAASFSSRGPAVWKTGSVAKPEIAAPGVKVLSSVPGGKYAELSGTSMATPHVAGLFALMYQINPKLEVEKAVQIMRGAADKVGADPNTFGAGRINALKTAAALKP